MMISVVFFGQVKISVGVAILAAKEAGVVHANIPAHDAPAVFPLGWIFSSCDRDPEFSFNPGRVYAFAGMNSAVIGIDGF